MSHHLYFLFYLIKVEIVILKHNLTKFAVGITLLSFSINVNITRLLNNLKIDHYTLPSYEFTSSSGKRSLKSK